MHRILWRRALIVLRHPLCVTDHDFAAHSRALVLEDIAHHFFVILAGALEVVHQRMQSLALPCWRNVH